MTEEIFNWAYKVFKNWGYSEIISTYINLFVNMIQLAIFVFIIHYIFKKILIEIFSAIAQRTKTEFDDLLIYCLSEGLW